MKKIYFISLFLLAGCSSEPKTELVSAKFSSMDECLEKIKSASGYSTLRPMTDKPTHVSGYLGDTNFDFNCELKNTGTEGIYVEGWYDKEI